MSADVDALPDMLARLKLTVLRDRLDSLLDEAARSDLSLRETLALLCRAEVSHREERRIQMGTGIAKFPHQRTLEGFDFAAQPSLDARQVRDLAACRWVANGDALLIQGPPGVGKTHVSIAVPDLRPRGRRVVSLPRPDQVIAARVRHPCMGAGPELSSHWATGPWASPALRAPQRLDDVTKSLGPGLGRRE